MLSFLKLIPTHSFNCNLVLARHITMVENK
jgi:hypothetical protein